MRRATRRAADAGATRTADHQQVAEALDGDEQREREQHEQREVDDERRARRAPGALVRSKPTASSRPCSSASAPRTTTASPAASAQVGVRHAEHVAEEQALQPGRRGGREREQDAGAEERRDHDGDGGVAPDGRHLPGERDRERRDEQARGAAEQQRQAGERGDDQPRQQRVRQRLRAVGEAVEDDPAPERAAGHAEQGDLEQRAPADRIGPRIGERVQHGEHQW